MVKTAWRIIIHVVPPEKRQELLKYCQNASQKDPTFKIKQIDKYIIIELPTKDRCHRVGMLLHHKYGVYYEVEYEKTYG